MKYFCSRELNLEYVLMPPMKLSCFTADIVEVKVKLCNLDSRVIVVFSLASSTQLAAHCYPGLEVGCCSLKRQALGS